MPFRRSTGAFAAGAAFIAAATFAMADEAILIRPIHLFIKAGASTATLNLKNTNSDTPERVQLTAYDWKSGSITDIAALAPATDLVVFPTLLVLPKGEERTIRVAAPPAATSERSYRLLVERVDPPRIETGNSVTIKTRYSIPIYVEPSGAVAKPQITGLGITNGKVHFVLTNSGNEHFVARRVLVSENDAEKHVVATAEVEAGVVLPTDRESLTAPLATADCKKTSSVTVTLTPDEGDAVVATSPVSSGSCNV